MRQIAEMLQQAKHVIVFTGAGMSTESGLPDFRSPNRGLWTQFNPDELANLDALKHNTEEFIDFYRARLQAVTDYTPHKGHRILAEWEHKGIISGIITQNVDGFHHDAGSQNVMELHGTFRKFYCHDCHKEYDRQAFLDGKSTCHVCGGIIRPGIVLFGETLPTETFYRADDETMKADLFIVFGSSLNVTPANTFPAHAKQNGAHIIIVNREATPFDDYADHIIQDKRIGEVLTGVHEHLFNET